MSGDMIFGMSGDMEFGMSGDMKFGMSGNMYSMSPDMPNFNFIFSKPPKTKDYTNITELLVCVYSMSIVWYIFSTIFLYVCVRVCSCVCVCVWLYGIYLCIVYWRIYNIILMCISYIMCMRLTFFMCIHNYHI